MTRVRPADAWNRFWFTPQPTSTVALFRIAAGAVTLLWAFGLLPGLHDFFSSTGIEPVGVDTTWGLFAHWHGDVAIYVGWGVLVLSSMCVVVGFRTRVATVVQFVLVFSFLERSMPVFNSGDGLLRIVAFVLMFMPAGESLSLDRWRRDREHFWEFPERAPWALRLMQVQISLLYLSSARHKLVGGAWSDGTALSYVWRMDDIVRFHVPGAIARSATVVALATFLALAVEILLGIFVWVRSARPLVLGLGVALHVAIDLTLRIGFFSAVIIASYLAFLSPGTAASIIGRVRRDRDALRSRQLTPGARARIRDRTRRASARARSDRAGAGRWGPARSVSSARSDRSARVR